MHAVELGGLHAVPLGGFDEGQPGTHPVSEIHHEPLSQEPWIRDPHPLFQAHDTHGLAHAEPCLGTVVGHEGGGGGGGGGGHGVIEVSHRPVPVLQYAKSHEPHGFGYSHFAGALQLVPVFGSVDGQAPGHGVTETFHLPP